jgi:predicted enzyme related to lactoylglutathione lyase
MDLRIQCLCIDTTDPARLGAFWQQALGWRRTDDGQDEDEVVLEAPADSKEDGVAPDLLFLRVPEATHTVPKTKNKLHLDLRIGEDDVDTVVAKLTERGATFLWTGEQGPHRWVTMADPEGNEFCVYK